jgi:homoserine dehydrogenase
MERIKIGLFGFGTVGKGFYELLKHHDLPVDIHKVCVRQITAERQQLPIEFTTSPEVILEDENIAIVVEVISDSLAAREIVYRALKNGKAVISANKKMIGDNLGEVVSWLRDFRSEFLYEASSGGAIPVITTIDSYFRDHEIQSIRGILNGSSNYILTQMHLNGLSFEQALDQAQSEGFAEEDPSLDVDGLDALNKLKIIGYHAFNAIASDEDIKVESIRSVNASDISQAISSGKKIKPLAEIYKKNGKLSFTVKPVVINSGDEFYNVEYEYNGVSIATMRSGNHLLVGKGAGAHPTGSAVIKDLKTIIKNRMLRNPLN